MSLAINPAEITAIILKDGTSFTVVANSPQIDTYEYVQRYESFGKILWHDPDNDETASSLGMEIVDAITGRSWCFPLSSILAVQLDSQFQE